MGPSRSPGSLGHDSQSTSIILDQENVEKLARYSDGKQLRDFLKTQLFGTIPELTANTIADPGNKDKTIIVTGANTGLGLEASKQFLKLGVVKRLVMACRNAEKGQKAKEQVLAQLGTEAGIEVLVWDLDMSSRASVRAFAERAGRELDRIDAVVLNAGVDLMKYERASEQDGGYEMTLMVNVVGTMVLTGLMVPVLRAKNPSGTRSSRITIVGSAVQFMIKYNILLEAYREQKGEGILGWLSHQEKWQGNIGQDRYFLSKGILQMVVKQLADVVSESAKTKDKAAVTINCAAPGLCRTDLFRDQQTLSSQLMLKAMGRDAHVGARALVIGAVGINGGPSSHGRYMSEGQVKCASSWFETDQGKLIAKKLWEEIARELETTKKGALLDL